MEILVLPSVWAIRHDRMWTNAFVGDLCLVCSRPMSDLSLSKSVSMMNLFRNGSLSNIALRWFFMFPRLPVIGYRPFFQSRAKRFFESLTHKGCPDIKLFDLASGRGRAGRRRFHHRTA